MKLRTYWIFACLVLVILFTASLAGSATATPHLNWHTTNVYFDDAGQPVIIGYFYNDGTIPVDKVNLFRQQLYLQKGDGSYFLVAAGAWKDIDLYLRPGEESGRCLLHFADYSGPVYDYDRWKAQGDVNYHIAPEVEI